MSTNTTLWDSVCKTPPSETKAITGKPYQGTSPKPYWIVRKATETFGPCGIGWGLEIVNERVEEGAAGDKIHIAHVRVWYVLGDKRGVVEHVGQTAFSGTRNNGKTYTDEDAPKKSVTDALIKALSLIGFAGDIFMGRYDDSKYVNELRAEERAEAAKPPVDDDGPTQSEMLVVSAAKKAIDMAKTPQDIDDWRADETNARAIESLPELLRKDIGRHARLRRQILSAELVDG